MSEGPSGDRSGPGDSGRGRLFLFAAVLAAVAALVLAEAFNLGVGHARRFLAGGSLPTMARDLTLMTGVAVSVLLGVLAIVQRHRRPRLGVLIVVGLAVAWPGWAAGYATGIAEGPAAEYAGSVQISAGPQVLGSVPVGCASVVGDPGLLAGVAVRTNGFQMNLRNNLDRTFEPGISGEAILSGVAVFFDPGRYVPVEEVVENGMDGRGTAMAAVIPASGGARSEALVSIEWTCDPATRTYP